VGENREELGWLSAGPAHLWARPWEGKKEKRGLRVQAGRLGRARGRGQWV
jgi:hypothetical protein